MNLKEIFGDSYASTQFQFSGDSVRLTGKHGEAEVIGDCVDFWYWGSEYKITAIQKKIPDHVAVNRLNGELWAQVADAETARQLASLLGCKKRPAYSEQAMEKKRAHMRQISNN